MPSVDTGAPTISILLAAAERAGCLPAIDRNVLATPGAHFPQIGHSKADRRERHCAGLADAKRRRQYRIGATGDLDRGESIRRRSLNGLPARRNPVLEPAPNRTQCILCYFRSARHPPRGAIGASSVVN